MNDGVLVEALRARDPGALAALYDTYAESLYRYCRTLLAGPDAAQVALRDTLIAAEALVGSLADPHRFRPWLYALARGECMRRRTPGPEDGPGTGPVPVATLPFPGIAADGATAEGTDLRIVAAGAVGALSPEDREVLELAARHGMTGQDLAAVLGTGERYAEGLLDAATERLRETVTAEILARRATHDCERASAILEGFTGELTPQTRAQLIRHLARCEICGRQRVRQISAAKVFGLLPQVALPETLRVRVLSSFIDPELVPYRRYVAKRVGKLNAAGYPRAGRREGRLAQAVAGAVAALAAAATIALVFAQFAGDLREQAADTIAPHRLPTAEAPVSPPAASREGSDDAAEGAAGRSPAPPVSRDLAEPVVPVAPVEPVALPRPAPLPPPAPPSAVRPHRPAPPVRPPVRPTVRPSVRPTGAPSATVPSPGASPSGPTPVPTITPGTPGTEPSPGGSGSDGQGSDGQGSDGQGSGGPGSGRPRGGPPPAHWPGHRPPWRDHQHHPRPHRECPPTPEPSHGPSGDHGGPPAVPPVRGGHGSGHGGRYEARGAGGGARPLPGPWPARYGGAAHERPGRAEPDRGGSGRDGSHRDGPGPGRDGAPPGVRATRESAPKDTERRGAAGGPAAGSSGGPGRPGGSGDGHGPGGGSAPADPKTT
ncbi:sigma-70 family RNA polymerase sigma factor [Microbispora sp. H10836]|uniref:sigma-70 family RNA polymerase sigma factor n=1 Tax=Microbispora sp. H10836 TaxID=2729106 RepID=UPI0014735139|nr:sigma-70 family RNA polymerase sigma factor [Microbispora sp. H10836]